MNLPFLGKEKTPDLIHKKSGDIRCHHFLNRLSVFVLTVAN